MTLKRFATVRTMTAIRRLQMVYRIRNSVTVVMEPTPIFAPAEHWSASMEALAATTRTRARLRFAIGKITTATQVRLMASMSRVLEIPATVRAMKTFVKKAPSSAKAASLFVTTRTQTILIFVMGRIMIATLTPWMVLTMSRLALRVTVMMWIPARTD